MHVYTFIYLIAVCTKVWVICVQINLHFFNFEKVTRTIRLTHFSKISSFEVKATNHPINASKKNITNVY